MFAVFSVSAAREAMMAACGLPAHSLTFFFSNWVFAARSFSDVGLPSSRFSALAALIQSQSIKPPLPSSLHRLHLLPRAHTRGKCPPAKTAPAPFPLLPLACPLSLCLAPLAPSSQSEPTNQHTHSLAIQSGFAINTTTPRSSPIPSTNPFPPLPLLNSSFRHLFQSAPLSLLLFFLPLSLFL